MIILKIDYFLCPFAPEKKRCSNYHSVYHRFQPWHNAKAPKVGFQWIPTSSDAAHTSMNPPLLDFLAF